MNLIPKICELLGLEIGEEFTFSDVSDRYRFVMKGLQYYDKDYKEWLSTSEITLNAVLTGTAKIKKLPFEPKEAEAYYFVSWNKSKHDLYAGMAFWTDNVLEHYANKFCGNCFRTKAEAEREKYNVYERLTGRKWEE